MHLELNVNFLNFQVPLWTVDEVCHWVSKLNFSNSIVEKLREAQVDGDLLLQLDEKNLKEDLEMTNGLHRKRFLRELNGLKKSADYTCKDQNDIANFLAQKVGAEYKIYAYNLIRSDLSSPDLMRKLGETDLKDMLRECGVESAIHRHKIVEAVFAENNPEVSDSGSEGKTEVYISYDKVRSAELASMIRMKLAFRDVSVHSGHDKHGSYEEAAIKRIKSAKNFILVLSPDFMTEIQDKKNGYFKREIVTALRSGCNVIPVLEDGFRFPEPEVIPEDIRTLCYFNGVKWVHDYQDACIDKLERFIRGEAFAINPAENRINRSRADSGRSTPQLCNPNSPFMVRKRTISMDSAISAVSS